jgi:ribosomal protein S15P/S13E|tara:strand:- start:1640 stop:2053 length:414 start_codon:yes stop_codon:yes gene_type:complete
MPTKKDTLHLKVYPSGAKGTRDEKPEKEVKILKKLSQADFEKKVLGLAKKDLTAEKIGENLRKEGIHPKEYNKKISKILKDNDAYVNPDLKNVEEKLGKIREHYENNKQDKRSMRERDRIASQLRKLKKYFKISLKR